MATKTRLFTQIPLQSSSLSREFTSPKISLLPVSIKPIFTSSPLSHRFYCSSSASSTTVCVEKLKIERIDPENLSKKLKEININLPSYELVKHQHQLSTMCKVGNSQEKSFSVKIADDGVGIRGFHALPNQSWLWSVSCFKNQRSVKKLYSIPRKFLLNLRYISVHSTSESPISEEIFKSSPILGSYKQGDSTFYTLIENYASSGDFRSIENVFDRMKRERRVFIEKSFIHVIKAYGRANLSEKAVEMFDRMANEFQCRQTVRSFNSVLNVIIHQALFCRALDFYSYVVRTKNILPNVLTYNLVIKAMCRLGLVDRAVETFREMPHRKCTPDVFTYCTLMDGLCKENRTDDAVQLLDEMQKEGCFPSQVTFNVLINGLCKNGDMARAANLVENMFLKGCVPNEVTYNTLIHGLCLKGKLDKAISLLDKMISNKCVPNEVTYGTIFNGLVKQGRVSDGAQLLISMEERGHFSNEYVYSSLISGLFKEGKSGEALRLWGKMIKKGLKPNTVLYSGLIDGLCRNGKLDEAEEILSEMLNMGCKPNAFTYSSMIKGFFETGNSEKALMMWQDLEKDNNFVQNKVIYSVLINGLCKDRNINAAKIMWKNMLSKGCKPDVVAYSSMINGLCNDGLLDEGLKLFNEILYGDSTSEPDIVTYNILFDALCKHGKISHAIDLLNSMLERNIDPDTVTCNIFLKTLREKMDPPQDGREFLDELVVRLYKRDKILGASRILEVMLQKFLCPKGYTWERVIRGICKPRKICVAIDKCWTDLFC